MEVQPIVEIIVEQKFSNHTMHWKGNLRFIAPRIATNNISLDPSWESLNNKIYPKPLLRDV